MRYLIWLAVLTAFLVSGTAFGDEVILKNGEHIIGTVSKASDGKLMVTSANMGDVSIPLAEIVTFSTNAPIELHFADKSIVNREVTAAGDGFITVPVGAAGNQQQFKISDIEKINPPKSKWTGSLNAGITVSRGNTYTEGANAALNAVRRSEIDRITFDAAYTSQRTKDTTTKVTTTNQRQMSAGLQYDYFFTEKVYGYANARAERDAIAKIDLRLLAGLGVGWQVHESDTFNLSTETGISWISESYLPPDPPDLPTSDVKYYAARVAYDMTGNINESVSYFHSSTGYFGFESEGGYLVSSEAGLRSSLTDSMFTEIKALWAWDSTPAKGKKRTDVTYLLSVGWTF